MKHFPFKILLVSILLPPVLYIVTLQILEAYFQKRETFKLNQIMIQNPEALYEGRYALKEEINRNLGKYLSGSLKNKLGVRIRILVKTKGDRILYPAQFSEDLTDSSLGKDFVEAPVETLNFVEVAAENYRILNEGLSLSVDVQIKHNSWLSNGILGFYILLFVLILQRVIKKAMGETERQETEHKKLIENLSSQLAEGESKFKEAEAKEADYLKRINGLRKDKDDLSTEVDALIEEIEKLEVGLETQTDLKEETEFEMLQLREELDRLKGKLKKPKKKKKRIDATNKRFKVLYKDLAFTERAIEGFLALSEEFQLKAEEVIHRLNEDESQVAVRRKVFGKGGKLNILEVDFSYSGRVYFQKDTQSKTKILAIGTKNTQERDLAFIESVV